MGVNLTILLSLLLANIQISIINTLISLNCWLLIIILELNIQKLVIFGVSSTQLEHVHSHIKQYLQRFRNFLGPGNRRYIQTLLVVARAFLQILLNGKDTSLVDPGHDAEKAFGAKSASDSSMAINDFLFSLNIDNINLVKLLHYIKESNIIHKVIAYYHHLSIRCYPVLLILSFLHFPI